MRFSHSWLKTFVDLHDAGRPVRSLAEARRQRAGAEAVDLPEDGAVGAAREPPVLLVDETEREQLRRLELLTATAQHVQLERQVIRQRLTVGSALRARALQVERSWLGKG